MNVIPLRWIPSETMFTHHPTLEAKTPFGRYKIVMTTHIKGPYLCGLLERNAPLGVTSERAVELLRGMAESDFKIRVQSCLEG